MDLPATADIVVMEWPAEHALPAAEALDSCRLVLGAEGCRSSTQAGPTPSYYATIEWQPGTGSKVRVEVRRERVDGPLVNVREVEFGPEDTLAQRYRALGLLVVSHIMADTGRSDATAASETAASEPAVPRTQPIVKPTASTPPAGPPPDVATSPLQQASTDTGFGVDLGGQLGAGASNAFSRRGVFLRPWLGPFVEMWRPFARVGWIADYGAVDIDGYEAALGLGLTFHVASAFAVEVNASGVYQHLRFRASDRQLGTDQAALDRYGARVGVEGEVDLGEHVGVWLGAEVVVATPPYSVDVKAERLGQEQGPKWGAVGGLRFRR